jgi:hypothetical protein
VIHDDLIRHFENKERPQLSADFTTNLRNRLRSPERPSALDIALRRWTPRLYWLGAAALLVVSWPEVAVTPVQVGLLAASAAVAARVWQRALRVRPLVRVLREALW